MPRKSSIQIDEIILGKYGNKALDSLSKLHELYNGKHSVEEIASQKYNIDRRYRTIYQGFLEHMELEELNRRLEKTKQKKLYARDLVEATLIYAFKSQMSYQKWCDIIDQLKQIWESGKYDDFLIYRKGRRTAFTLGSITQYVDQSSLVVEDRLYTIQKTKVVEEELNRISEDEGFVMYISENIRCFSAGREKARYYICKYFLEYLRKKKRDYVSGSKTKRKELYYSLPLSNKTGLNPDRYPSLSEEEVDKAFSNTKISLSKLYDLVQGLWESGSLKSSFAAETADSSMIEKEENEDTYNTMFSVFQGYGITRELLLRMLLFFDMESEYSDEGLILTQDRLNDILRACQFEQLGVAGFEEEDDIILKVIHSDDRRTTIDKINDDLYKRLWL